MIVKNCRLHASTIDVFLKNNSTNFKIAALITGVATMILGIMFGPNMMCRLVIAGTGGVGASYILIKSIENSWIHLPNLASKSVVALRRPDDAWESGPAIPAGDSSLGLSTSKPKSAVSTRETNSDPVKGFSPEGAKLESKSTPAGIADNTQNKKQIISTKIEEKLSLEMIDYMRSSHHYYVKLYLVSSIRHPWNPSFVRKVLSRYAEICDSTLLKIAFLIRFNFQCKQTIIINSIDKYIRNQTEFPFNIIRITDNLKLKVFSRNFDSLTPIEINKISFAQLSKQYKNPNEYKYFVLIKLCERFNWAISSQTPMPTIRQYYINRLFMKFKKAPSQVDRDMPKQNNYFIPDNCKSRITLLEEMLCLLTYVSDKKSVKNINNNLKSIEAIPSQVQFYLQPDILFKDIEKKWNALVTQYYKRGCKYYMYLKLIYISNIFSHRAFFILRPHAELKQHPHNNHPRVFPISTIQRFCKTEVSLPSEICQLIAFYNRPAYLG